MMAAYVLNGSKPTSLTARIRDAEQQVSNRQRAVGIRAATLIRHIRQQLTAPGSLLLAGGIGFIIGELTTRAPRVRGSVDTPSADETTPLRTALHLFTSVRTLYAALPITWMMKTCHRAQRASAKAPNRQAPHSAGATSHAAGEGQSDH